MTSSKKLIFHPFPIRIRAVFRAGIFLPFFAMTVTMGNIVDDTAFCVRSRWVVTNSAEPPGERKVKLTQIQLIDRMRREREVSVPMKGR